MGAYSLVIIGAGPGGLATGITAKEPGFESYHPREGRKHMSGHYGFLSERGKLP
jgi:thioredoxin reductase